MVFLIVRVGTLSAADEPATQDTTDALLELLEREPGNVDALSQLYAIYMRQGDYGEAQRYALRISEVAQENGDMHTEMLADSYIGQSWLAMDGYDSAYNYLNAAVTLWNSLDSTARTDESYNAIYTAYNGLGIYSVTIDMDFGRAIDYFVWLAGSKGSGLNRCAAYWKNDEPSVDVLSYENGLSQRIFIVDGNVIMTGCEGFYPNNVVKYWVNGEPTAVTDGSTSCVHGSSALI